MRILLTLSFIFSLTFGFAHDSNPAELFEQANKLSAEGKLSEALSKYKSIEDMGLASSDLPPVGSVSVFWFASFSVVVTSFTLRSSSRMPSSTDCAAAPPREGKQKRIALSMLASLGYPNSKELPSRPLRVRLGNSFSGQFVVPNTIPPFEKVRKVHKVQN